jgi:hypothetical protein
MTLSQGELPVLHAHHRKYAKHLACFTAPFVVSLMLITPHALASTLNVSFPATSQVGQQVTITASGETDTTDCDSNDGCGISVYLLPPGGFCSSDQNDVINENGSNEVLNLNPAFGDYSNSALPPPFTAPGTWTVCGFLNNDTIFYSQLSFTTGTIQVSEPPPVACVVPKYAGLTERQIIRGLLRAHCTGGRIIAVRSRLRKGQVVRLGDRPGTQLAHGAEVRIYISRGEPRRRNRR